MIFDVKAWTKVVAFHTRNAPHLAHEHIIAQACERSHADGVLIHPAIGPQIAGDLSGDAILGAYERLIQIAFPNALLASFANYPRYAGPREAVFNALCRKNFGCTHFVLGREHGDLDGFYAADASRALFESLGDIGITPVFFDTVYYSDEQGATVERPAATAGLREISGARIRELLSSDQSIPSWCMRGELSQWLMDERSAGTSLIVNGE